MITDTHDTKGLFETIMILLKKKSENKKKTAQ